MKHFAEKFGLSIDAVNKYWCAANIAHANEKENIFNLQSLDIFTYTKEKLIEIRNIAIKDPDNLVYCYLLREALLQKDSDSIFALGAPNKQLKDELYDTLPLFSLISLIPDMVAQHKKLGIPEDVTRDTCGMFENQIQEFLYVHHHFGISEYTSWMCKFLYSDIIRIGRLNFEICRFQRPYMAFLSDNNLVIMPDGEWFHKSGQVLGSIGCEDESDAFFAEIEEKDGFCTGYLIENAVCTREKITVPKTMEVLRRNDLVVSIHIPFGDSMTSDACDKAISRATEIISKCYGEFKFFYCGSWLLNPCIEKILGKKTNITRFGDRFARFPIKSNGSGVFEYVFMQPQNTPVDLLNETNSLSKAIKSHLKNGKHILDVGGIFFAKGE